MSDLMRPCLGCGQTDDHPKDQVVIPPDHTSVYWHLDCHSRITGCESCSSQIEGASGKTGQALRDHLMNKKG